MLFSNTLTALLVLGVGMASASDGFQVHPEQPDGVYTVATKHSAKFHNHIYGEPVLVRSYTPSNASSHRDNSTIPVLGTNQTLNLDQSGSIAPVEFISLPITYASSGCTGSFDKLNFWDYAEALRALGKRCDDGETIPASGWTTNTMIYSKVGSAIVYACSSGGVNSCNSAELYAFSDGMDKYCGDSAPGYFYMSDWKKYYGRTEGNKVCGGLSVASADS